MRGEREILLAGARLVARSSGALWWPEARLLCVADLHLAKSERIARRGGALLPPYETRETLERLAGEIAALDPACVVCLGDSFDDMHGPAGLEAEDRARLMALRTGRDWVWIKGNHDPGAMALGGASLSELRRGPLTFRHEAERTAAMGEISGHFHPKIRLARKGLRLSRPCFLVDARRMILPAFGAYTGGLWSDAPVLRGLMRAPVFAVLTGEPCLLVPG